MIFSLIIFFAGASCRETPKTIPTGKWDYDLIINGRDVGDAWVSIKKENGNYVNETELKLEFAGVLNTAYHKIIETTDFTPVSVEILNKTRTGSIDLAISTKASFNGQKVLLEADGKKSEINLGEPFRLEANFLMDSLIKGKFKKGLEFKYNIYEPSIEAEETIPITVKVEGPEKITVGGEERSLIMVRQTMKNFKSIRAYVDENGTIHKMVIVMLNNKLELELK